MGNKNIATYLGLLFVFYFIVGNELFSQTIGQRLMPDRWHFLQQSGDERYLLKQENQLQRQQPSLWHQLDSNDTGDSLNVRLVGHWAYGPCCAVAVSGNYAYFNNGYYLEIADVSNPDSPIRRGKLLVPVPIQAVAVSGNYAYVAAGRDGLRIIKVANPANPEEVGYFDTVYYAESVAVSGTYAYLADGHAGLRIIDVADPVNPEEVGHFDTGHYSTGVAVSDSYAYVADGYDGLRIINVADPANPQEVGYFDTGEWAYNVVVSDNYAYVADHKAGLRIIDVTNPDNPQEVGYFDTRGLAIGIIVSGSYAYVADADAGLSIIDVTNSANPQEVGYFNTDGTACGVAVSGNYAYVADHWAGLRILNIANSANPQDVEYLDTCGYTVGVAVSGNYAYVADYQAGLRILNIANPANPQQVGYCGTEGYAYGVAVSGSYGYVADGLAGLCIINIANPSNPQEVGYFDTGGNAENVAVSDSYVYVADGSDGLRIIDVNNLANLQEEGYFDTGGRAYGVAVNSTYAYVADGNAGLRIIDVANPANPQEVGFFDTGGDAKDVALSGGYAYVADYDAGLRIIDITNPANPQEVGYFNTSGNALDVAISKTYAYVADGLAGLRIINIANPANPQEVGYFDTDGTACCVAVGSNYVNYVYVADRNTGLYILEYLGWPPQSPALVQPTNGAFINDPTPSLFWNVPVDLEGDHLHFKVEVARDSSFISHIAGSPFESRFNTVGFSPTPPVTQGIGSCNYTLQTVLGDGTYFWQVSAWDGKIYGNPSEISKFAVDVTNPYASNHNPSKNASGVSVNTNILIHVQDALSGVKQSSIAMKVNGNAVSPTITGTALDYILTYNPEPDFGYNRTINVSVDAEDNAGNKMPTDSYSFSTVSDLVAPYTASHNPSKNAQDVPRNTNIVVHILDAVSGVNQSSIIMKVKGVQVTPTITGTSSDFTLIYDPSNNFEYQETINVSIDAKDIAGNQMSTDSYIFTTASSTDITAPQIAHSVVSIADSGQNITIEAISTDNVGVQEAKLYYRQGGQVNYTTSIMSNTNGDIYKAIIPGDSVTDRSIEYYILVKDVSNNFSTFPEVNAATNPQVIRVRISNFTSSKTTPPAAYRMISIPLDLDKPSPKDVLEDDWGAYNDKKWRLLHWVDGEYLEYTRDRNFDNFESGKGFWLITKDEKYLKVGSGYSVPTGENFSITLQPGWNQIGNPFTFPVDWKDVIRDVNKVENNLMGYIGNKNEKEGYRDNLTCLEPWEGYFIKNLDPNNPTTIEIPPKEAPGQLAKQAIDLLSFCSFKNKEWGVQITVECDRYIDVGNYIGCLQDANNEWDHNDFSEAPFFAEYVSLYFPHKDWEIYPGFYTGDFRSIKLEGDYWDFCVKTNVLNSEIILNLQEIQNLLSDWNILLLDKSSQLTIDFLEQRKYTFFMNRGEDVREFRIFVGAKKFIDKNNLEITKIPERYELTQNYPNPFNSETQIKYFLPISGWVNLSIYSIIGQKIRSLVSSYQGAGSYTVSWDGSTEIGNIVSSGIYLIKMESERFIKTRKMILAK